MIPLAIDREQLKEDFEEFQLLILGFGGGAIGFALAAAAILRDHIIFDILYGGTIFAGVLLFLRTLYNRYTITESEKSEEGGS